MDSNTEYELPENPEQVFFHGQYHDLDNYVCEKILKLGEFSLVGRNVKVLDLDPGVNNTGSPVSQDFSSRLTETGAEPEITVAGKGYKDVARSDNEFKYSNGVEELGDQKFDILRMFYFGEELVPQKFEEIQSSRAKFDEKRGRAISHLKEGGILIALQELKADSTSRDSFGDRREINYTPFIKIMQKRNGDLVPVGLFPSSFLPIVPKEPDSFFSSIMGWQRYKEAYAQFREEVHLRKQRVPAGVIDRENYAEAVKALHHAKPQVFDSERSFNLRGIPDGYDLNNQGREIFEKMGRYRKEAPDEFRKCVENNS